MGCFCEKLPGGGGVRHLEVLYVRPGKALLTHGGMGPMLSQAATGSMEIQFSAVPDGTKVVLTYAVAGYAAGGLNNFAAPTDSVVTEMIVRLKNYVERGDPAPVAK